METKRGRTPKRKLVVALPVRTKRRKNNAGRTQNPQIPRGFARGNNPLPFKLVTRLSYHSKYTLTGGAADAMAIQVINASSLYDPDYTGTGHQPLGFDQLMPIYDHYVVLGAKITVRFNHAYRNGPYAALVGVSGGAVVTPKTTATEYIEQGGAVHANMGISQSTQVVLNNFYSPKIHMGIPDPQSSDKLHGTISANPVDGWFFHIWATNAVTGETVTSVVADVTVEYLAAFIEPQELAQS